MNLDLIYAKLEERNLSERFGLSKKLVRGIGPVPCDVMFIGEAPGELEDKLGRPFVGRAGDVFEDLLELSDLTPNAVFVTNAVKYRPPNNRTPTDNELKEFVPTVREEIDLVNPRLIVPMGTSAGKMFFQGQTIGELRNRVHPRSNRNILPVYHPAAWLYDEKGRVRNSLKVSFKLIGEVLADS